VTDTLPPGAQLLELLRHDGEDLTAESHAGCPGRGAYFRSYDPTTPVHYCASPTTHGHTLRHGPPANTPSGIPTGGATEPSGSPGHGSSEAARRLVIRGNKAWKAAAEVRKRWLAAHLFPRRTAPREAAQFVAGQLLTMPDPIRSGLASAHSRSLFAEITGKPAQEWANTCATIAAGRLPLVMLAPIVTAYEQAMTEGEGKNTWRTDRYSPCPRREAGHYLTFLASIGYHLSSIEQTVSDGVPYSGDETPGESLPTLARDESAASPAEPGTTGEPIGSEADAITNAGDSDTAGLPVNQATRAAA
jgi:hypothetical protein